MPRKRTPRALRETPEARALRAAVHDELQAPLAPLSEKAEAKRARKAKKWVARVIERGGDLSAAMKELDREGLLAAPIAGDLYAGHRPAVKAETATAAAERVAAAPRTAPDGERDDTKRKARRRRPPGLIGYLPITDDDDWE
ncbi:hypothetical protein [Microbacterium sp. MTN4-26]|uniref:hypothetical protein n=1 Tax=unclassified Microbacterium TaxID=2609290 RepID=UPI0036F19FF8